MSAITRFVLAAINEDRQFSDLMIKTGRCVSLRRPAGWEMADFMPTNSDIHQFCSSVNEHYQNLLATGEQIERSMFLPDSHARIRVAIFSSEGGKIITMIVRVVPSVVPSVSDLDLPLPVCNFASAKSGLILIAGPTGSGKTTTCAALIRSINESAEKHIITLEDPIEYTHLQERSLITQREVGVDAKSFIQGLESAMRQRPDVIMVGEIRDSDTADASIRASESGHLVLATTHAKSALGGVQKVLSYFGSQGDAQALALSHCFVGAVYQRLLPSKDRDRFVLATEVVSAADPQVLKSIGKPAEYARIEDALNGPTGLPGCLSFNASLKHLVDKGWIEEGVAMAASNNPQALKNLLR